MECIVAKIFGSEAQKEAAIELFMKTHGGRAFLHGHLFGDNVHEYLAPCIYEGEGEMLGMALLQVADQGARQDLLRADRQGARRPPASSKPNPLNPAHAWALRKALVPYAKWCARPDGCAGWRQPDVPAACPPRLAEHAQFAADGLQRSRLEISDVMRKHQLKLADRQCRMAELSQRVQDLVVILATSLWAGRQSSELVQRRGRHPLPGPDPQAHRPAADRRLLPRRHQAGRDDRRRRLRGHRRHRGRGDPDAVRP